MNTKVTRDLQRGDRMFSWTILRRFSILGLSLVIARHNDGRTEWVVRRSNQEVWIND